MTDLRLPPTPATPVAPTVRLAQATSSDAPVEVQELMQVVERLELENHELQVYLDRVLDALATTAAGTDNTVEIDDPLAPTQYRLALREGLRLDPSPEADASPNTTAPAATAPTTETASTPVAEATGSSQPILVQPRAEQPETGEADATTHSTSATETGRLSASDIADAVAALLIDATADHARRHTAEHDQPYGPPRPDDLPYGPAAPQATATAPAPATVTVEPPRRRRVDQVSEQIDATRSSLVELLHLLDGEQRQRDAHPTQTIS